MDERLKGDVTLAGAKAEYDEYAKQILAHKIILAHILVGTVPEYKGIEVDCKISDEDVQAEIDSFLQDNSTEKKIKKGACKEGDSVNIDYVGKIDGKAFDNGTADHYPWVFRIYPRI